MYNMSFSITSHPTESPVVSASAITSGTLSTQHPDAGQQATLHPKYTSTDEAVNIQTETLTGTPTDSIDISVLPNKDHTEPSTHWPEAPARANKVLKESEIPKENTLDRSSNTIYENLHVDKPHKASSLDQLGQEENKRTVSEVNKICEEVTLHSFFLNNRTL